MEKTVTTTLRLPEQMLVKLKHMAVDSRRSFNNEVLVILEKALEEQGEKDAQAA